MKIEEKVIGELLLLRLSGAFTNTEVPDLHRVFEHAVSVEKRLVLELGFTKAPCLSILEPILTLAGTVHSKGKRLIVARASGNLRFLLTMLHKHDWFEFHEAINELVIAETHKLTIVPMADLDEKVELKPVFYHIPNVTDFDLD